MFCMEQLNEGKSITLLRYILDVFVLVFCHVTKVSKDDKTREKAGQWIHCRSHKTIPERENKINKFFESKIFLEIVQKIANAKVHIEILLTQSLVSRSVVLNKVSVDYKCFLNTNHVLLEH